MQGMGWDAGDGVRCRRGRSPFGFPSPFWFSRSAGTQLGVAVAGRFWGGNPSFPQPPARAQPRRSEPRCRQPSQTRIPDIVLSFLCSQEIHISWEVEVSPGSSGAAEGCQGTAS